MLSRHSETRRTTLILLDQLMLAGALGVSLVVAQQLAPTPVAGSPIAGPSLAALLPFALAVAVGTFIGLSCCGLYRARTTASPSSPHTSEVLLSGMVLHLIVLGAGGAWNILTVSPLPRLRATAWLFVATGLAALWFSRYMQTAALRGLSGKRDRVARVVVFGMSRRMLHLLATFQRSPDMRLQVVGVVADEVPPDVAPRMTAEQSLALMQQGRVEHVLVDVWHLEREQLNRIAEVADREGISIHITSPMFPTTTLVPTWERVDGIPVLGFVSAELSFGARLAKRSFDVVVSSSLLAVLSLPMLIIGGIIRLVDRSAALYTQRRVGKGGRTFTMLKFRTMREDAEASGPLLAVTNDPRCTRFGKLLRRTNLDELPQLMNVLLGDMSLVGPRPERVEFVERYKRSIPRYAHKHWVKPGITGWAQIHGLRGSHTSLEQRVEHDLFYIENWSLVLDIRILVRTLFDGYLNAA